MTARSPWHALGHDVAGTETALDAMTLGGLVGWGLRKAPLTADGLPVPDRFALVKGSPFGDVAHEVLAVVGTEAKVRQNDDYAPLLDALVEETGATFSAAGVVEDARRAFVALHLPGHQRIAGERVDFYLALVIDRREKEAGVTLVVTAVHEATGAVLPTIGTPWRVTPTSSARPLVDSVFGVLEHFVTLARRLAARETDRLAALRRLHALYGPERGTSGRKQSRDARIVEEMTALADEADDVPTDWHLALLLAAWFDQHAQVQVRGGTDTLARRAARALLDPTWKRSAWATL